MCYRLFQTCVLYLFSSWIFFSVVCLLFLLFSCFQKKKETIRVKKEESKGEKKKYFSFLPYFKTYENKVDYHASSLFEVLDGEGNLEKMTHCPVCKQIIFKKHLQYSSLTCKMKQNKQTNKMLHKQVS